MSVKVDGWAMCDDCGCPRILMPDNKRCARCLGTNLRKLLALENDRQDGGLMTLREAGRRIAPQREGGFWLENVKFRHAREFPDPIVIVGNRGFYDLDELSDFVYEWAARPPVGKGVTKITLKDLPPRPARPRSA